MKWVKENKELLFGVVTLPFLNWVYYYILSMLFPYCDDIIILAGFIFFAVIIIFYNIMIMKNLYDYFKFKQKKVL